MKEGGCEYTAFMNSNTYENMNNYRNDLVN